MTSVNRPRFHFTAPTNWLNDPNGLVVVDGVFHMFYQHHPFGESFGPPHWGHAVSRDLIDWEYRGIALEPDELGVIFSGSAAIDHEGDAGFGAGAIVAAFTHHLETGVERQSLAYSIDGGSTFEKYAGNPVLEAPPGIVDFRDPKIFKWHSGKASHWVMALAVGPAVWLYTSTDLRTWDRASVFATGDQPSGVWECPDLFELPIEGTDETAWVMVVGAVSERLPYRFATRFFVGTFDGRTFETQHRDVHWADFGADFYSAQTWSDVPDGSKIWVGWMSNWSYAAETPFAGWRGAMSTPRRLGLRETPVGLRLTERPVAGLLDHHAPIVEESDLVIGVGDDPLAIVRGTALDLELEIDLAASTARQMTIDVRVGSEETTRVVVDLVALSVAVDRHLAGSHLLHSEYGGPRLSPFDVDRPLLDVRVLADATSVEVFAAGGTVVITEQIFPNPASDGVHLAAVGGEVRFSRLAASTIE